MLDVERDFPGSAWWLGTVISREDPEGLCRIKARIPGKIAETDWAMPVGILAGQRRGAPQVPPLGSRVIVCWLGGDIDNVVVYLPGVFHRGWVPSGHEAAAAGDNFIWQNDLMRVEIDTRAASGGLRITNLVEAPGATPVDSAGTDVVIDVDLISRQVRIATTLGLKIEAVGAVEIEGGSVAINGRRVAPGSGAI